MQIYQRNILLYVCIHQYVFKIDVVQFIEILIIHSIGLNFVFFSFVCERVFLFFFHSLSLQNSWFTQKNYCLDICIFFCIIYLRGVTKMQTEKKKKICWIFICVTFYLRMNGNKIVGILFIVELETMKKKNKNLVEDISFVF